MNGYKIVLLKAILCFIGCRKVNGYAPEYVIITREQIKIYQGVLSKRINYIELYRVYDYEEKQSFIQSLINNTNIYIYSGDKSTPELLMNGLKANSDIIQTIRNRVEEQKKKKGIYEFTNR